MKATYIIQFIAPSDIPTGQKVTYASFACDYRKIKTEPWRVRLVVGGENVTYSEDTGFSASNMIETCFC